MFRTLTIDQSVSAKTGIFHIEQKKKNIVSKEMAS